MISIRVMAEFGRWTFLRVDDKEADKANWEFCERQGCGEQIRYVHVCQIEGEEKEWRIGSTCGPALMNAAEEIWNRAVKDAAQNLKLLHRLRRLLPLEEGPQKGRLYRDKGEWVTEGTNALTEGRGFRHQQLRILQNRTRLAEKHHGLPAMKFGPGN